MPREQRFDRPFVGRKEKGLPPEELEGIEREKPEEDEGEEEAEMWPGFELGEEEADVAYEEERKRYEEEMGSPYGTGFDIEQATKLKKRIVALASYFDKIGMREHADTMDKVLGRVVAKLEKLAAKK